ncbi:unnamed protein product [Gadus morhua 'NCC']
MNAVLDDTRVLDKGFGSAVSAVRSVKKPRRSCAPRHSTHSCWSEIGTCALFSLCMSAYAVLTVPTDSSPWAEYARTAREQPSSQPWSWGDQPPPRCSGHIQPESSHNTEDPHPSRNTPPRNDAPA